MTKTFHSFPAYDVIEGATVPFGANAGMLQLAAGDQLALIEKPTSHYRISSVISYAMKNNDCPIAAVDRARANGHDLHFIVGLGSSITAERRAKVTYIGVSIGQRVAFEGRVFELVAAANNNIALREVAG